MKKLAKWLLKKYGQTRKKWSDRILSPYEKTTLEASMATNQAVQVLLAEVYRESAARSRAIRNFQDVEFRVFSQNGEDGILLYLFSLIGTTNRRVIEMCAGDGIECNAANLIVNHGWQALLFDGDPSHIARGRGFYKDCPDTRLLPPQLVHAWITTENVNALIKEHGFSGEVDLFSLDMDGVDYWIWKAIDCVSPRVVVLEYNNLWGPGEAVTVKYQPNFRSTGAQGASLAAFAKLGKEKGYRLVGCNRYGFNAFFVRQDLGEAFLPEVSVSACLENPFTRRVQAAAKEIKTDPSWTRV